MNDFRTLVLDTARVITTAEGWGAVKMARLASEVGVSRQTLHTQFGTRAELGDELSAREVKRIAAGIEVEARDASDVVGAVRAAVRYTLNCAANDPFVHAMLVSARSGDDVLLPLVSSRSTPILSVARNLLTAMVARHLPDADPVRTQRMADAVTRLTVSHAVLPEHDIDVVATELAHLFALGLETYETTRFQHAGS